MTVGRGVPRTFRGESGLWLALAIIAVVALPAAYLALPHQLVHDDLGTKVEVAKARNDARTSAIQLVGAMVVAVGLILTARTYLLAKQGQLTERFAKAVEQLGDDQSAVRIGGIFALGRLATDGDVALAEHVREILAAYIREHASVSGLAEREAGAAPSADVQVALSVLGGLPTSADPTRRRTDLSDTDLRHADLRDVVLVGVQLGGAHLEWADVTDADLRDASLVNAFCDHADFSRAVLEEAKFLGTQLHGALLVGARCKGAVFDGADLTAAADLQDAKDLNLANANTDATTRR